MRVASALLALIAVACLAVAIVGMVTGRPSDRRGFWLRLAAVGCFGVAVLLNVLAH
jgi:VIT1/CCC1 family predicted Fe2+/Mn2+ transporter